MVKPAFPLRGNGAHLRRRPLQGGKAENQRTDTFPPLRIRGAGAGGSLDRAGLGPGAYVPAQPGAAHVRSEHRFRLDRDAGRPGARGGGRRPGGLHAARRPQQRRLGLVGRTGRHLQHAASQEPAGPTATRARGPAKPHRGPPFLAGPLRGTVGIHCAPAAVPDDARPAGQSHRTCLPVSAARLFRFSAQHSARKIARPLRAIWKTNSSR